MLQYLVKVTCSVLLVRALSILFPACPCWSNTAFHPLSANASKHHSNHFHYLSLSLSLSLTCHLSLMLFLHFSLPSSKFPIPAGGGWSWEPGSGSISAKSNPKCKILQLYIFRFSTVELLWSRRNSPDRLLQCCTHTEVIHTKVGSCSSRHVSGVGRC